MGRASRTIVKIWRISLDIHGTYSIIRQIVGSGIMTIILGRFIWYWQTLPTGLRILFIVVIFCSAWWIVAKLVSIIRGLTEESLIKRIKQDKGIKSILDTVEAMDKSLSIQIPNLVSKGIPEATKRHLNDQFLGLIGTKIDKKSISSVRKARWITLCTGLKAITRVLFDRRQFLVDIRTLLNTNDVGLSSKEYDRLNTRLDKLLRLASDSRSRAVYKYLDYSNGVNSLLLFVSRDIDSMTIKIYLPFWVWAKIKGLAYRRDQMMRILYNRLAINIASMR